MNCFLKMNNVSVRYDDVIALKDITLQINKGDFIGLLGSNGAGKSTLIILL
ncbi:TPA: ATP-binding cassette domain-containing protein [Streptococcus pneumoniae]|nr:ATP-binding cassette domain-containing protein [Streptococcus pneumoniae]